MNKQNTIAPSTELGSLGVPHLKRIWSAAITSRNGGTADRPGEMESDRIVLNALGLGLHQTIQFLFCTAPSFKQFEDWVRTTVGEPDSLSVERLQSTFAAVAHSETITRWLRSIEEMTPVLTDADLAFWEEHGYVILKNVISPEQHQLTEQVIWEYVKADPESSDSWYGCSVDHGIMVELIQHPALVANRHSERIHKAFTQLWGTADLWPSADRCGFHPPQRDDHPFPGPDLHWDIDFDLPLSFGTQGILYLTDTPAEQGAFTLVPGFHKRLAEWLNTLEPGADPQQQDLHALGSKPIAGEAGDMVIWNHLLPHGSSPNLGRLPRIVQYINMIPFPARSN